MKILQVITRSELRGAEVFAAQLSERLAERGHAVTLAALYSPVPDNMFLNTHGVLRVELGGHKKGRIEPKLLYRMIRLLRDVRPDVVQANAFHALKYVALAKSLKQYSGALVYRNISISSKWITRNFQRRWGEWLLRKVDAVSSVSDGSNHDFCKTYRLAPDRVTTIRRGIDIPESLNRESARKQIANLIGCESDVPLLFHVGGFTEEKNHQGLLEAFQKIQQQHQTARLVLCGEGPLFKQIESHIQKRHLSDSVHLLGARDDAKDLMIGADILLLTSRVEGIPGVVLEAAVRNVPAISTNVGAVSEAIRNGETGLLVPEGDSEKMAEATCHLISDPSLRSKMGKQAREFIITRHSMKNSVNQFEKLYESLTQVKTSGLNRY